MTDRTKLKENRNNWLWYVWVILTISISSSLESVFKLSTEKPLEASFLWALGLQFIFVVYRVLTFCFNSFLAKIVKKRFKINRLKGRVNPIYNVYHEHGDKYFTITRYSVNYTPLKLQWSLPFSILFEEQEYIEGESYYFDYDLEDVTDISLLWEEQDASEKLKYNKKISAKTLKEQKIEKLNKVFNENYK